jgi:hypothetical protein
VTKCWIVVGFAATDMRMLREEYSAGRLGKC